MTGKRNDSTAAPNETAQPLTKAQRVALAAELTYHDESAAALERNGNKDTYHHSRAAEIRAQLEQSEVKDAQLD